MLDPRRAIKLTIITIAKLKGFAFELSVFLLSLSTLRAESKSVTVEINITITLSNKRSGESAAGGFAAAVLAASIN